MAAAAPKPLRYDMLLDLAQEKSSDKRRQLLATICDGFTGRKPDPSSAEEALLDGIAERIALELEAEALRELTQRIAGSYVPPKFARAMAKHADAGVAAPILSKHEALSDADLVDVVRHRSANHQMAVAKRRAVSEQVAETLIDHAGETVLVSLMENKGAKIGRTGFEKITQRAHSAPALQAPLVKRKDAPLDLINALYFQVEKKLRKLIDERNYNVTPAELEAALRHGKSTIMQQYAAESEADRRAAEEIRAEFASRKIDAGLIVRLLREKKTAHALHAVAMLSGAPAQMVRSVFEEKNFDALAILARGSGIDRAGFVTIATLMSPDAEGFAQAEKLGRLYQDVPEESAKRVLRFMQVRTKLGAEAA